MKLVPYSILVLAAAVLFSSAAPTPPLYKPGEVLVKLRPRATAAASEHARTKVRGRRRKQLRMNGIEVWQLDDPQADVEAAVATLEADPAVECATPNHYLRLLREPNDPDYALQWALKNTGLSNGIPGVDVDAPAAWEFSTGNDVIVAVIDTGVNYRHEDLAPNMWINHGEIPGDEIDNDENGYVDDYFGIDAVDGDDPMDDDGHGSHCAGIIAAAGNNSIGVAGISWSARIMALDFFDPSGWGEEADAIECIEYALAHGARVINASWGGDPYNPLLYEAIELCSASNCLFVAGAGNDGNDNDVDPFYPATYTNAGLISVAASDNRDEMASFSCYGSNSVDLAAPGVDILSTVTFNDYAYKNGTSMATPHVTGAAALLLALKPSMTPLELKQALLNGAEDVPAFAGRLVTGGRLNLYNAILEILPLIEFEQREYFVDENALVTLYDQGLAGATAHTVRITTSDGDVELLELSERAPGGLIFTNLVSIALGAPTPSNGIIEAWHGTDIFALHNSGTVTGHTLVDLSLDLTITSTPVYVPLQQQSFSVAGRQNGTVSSGLTVSNETTGEAHSFVAASGWTAPATLLTPGLNRVHVFGTNAFGFAATSTVELTLCGPSGATNFVDCTGGHAWPFVSPATAATSLHDAVAASYHGNLVSVSNGTYAGGLLVDKRVHLRAEGPVVIDGGGARVCMTVTGWGTVDGFSMRNGSNEHGGAVELEAGVLVNCTLESNKAVYGGGVYCHNYTFVSNCVLRGNSAERGGGAYCNYSSTVAWSQVIANAGHDRAGGVYCYYGRVHDCLVVQNITTNRGGGIYAGRGSTVQRCTVVSNWAKYFGGGVYLLSSWMRECALIGNYADSQGGGLFANRETAAINSIICGNTSKSLGGGVYFKFGTMTNCTVTGNRSQSIGGGALCDPGRMINSIIYHNSAVAGNEYFSANQNTVVKYCTTYPLAAGVGNRTNAPRFMGWEYGDVRLRASSPCRDTGSNAFVLGSVDVHGGPRIVNGTVDMGACEFKLGGLECFFEADVTNVLPLETVTFSSEAWGTNASGLVYAWDFDADDTVELYTNATRVAFAYADEGRYSVRLTVSNARDERALYARTAYIDVVPEPLALPGLVMLGAVAATLRRAAHFDHSNRRDV